MFNVLHQIIHKIGKKKNSAKKQESALLGSLNWLLRTKIGHLAIEI